jgi:hypothetical protein
LKTARNVEKKERKKERKVLFTERGRKEGIQEEQNENKGK